jgi:hypothetical protein
LVLHPAWSLDEADAGPSEAWRRIRDELSAPPHQLIGWSNSGLQGVAYAITKDREHLLLSAQHHAPTEGVARFVARIWDSDPRHAPGPPHEVELTAPQPIWPRAGYADDLLEQWSEAATSESSISPH